MAKPDASSSGDEKQKRRKLDTDTYEAELLKLQIELVKLQEWIKLKGLRVVTIFEGRDAAGKGVTINFKRGEGIDQFGREQSTAPERHHEDWLRGRLTGGVF